MSHKIMKTNVHVKKNNRYIRATLCFTDALEKKVVLLAISKIDNFIKQGLINPKQPQQIDFYLSTTEIQTCLNINSNDTYEQLKDIAYKIARRMIEIDTGKSFAFITPFPYCTYENNILHLRSELSMFNTLVNYTDSAGFTEYLLENIKRIRSPYTIAGYEVLRSYLYLENVEIQVEDLKKMLGVIEAVPKNPKKPMTLKNRMFIDKCVNYKDFKRDILLPMQKSFEKYTDITFTFEPKKKKGNKIISLLFTIEKNTKNTHSLKQIESRQARVNIPKELKPLVDELKTFLPKSLKNQDYLDLLNLSNNNVQLIKCLSDYTNDKGNKIRSKLAYIKKGLQEHWLNDASTAITYESNDVKVTECNSKEKVPQATKPVQMSLADYNIAIPNTNNKFNAFPQREYTKEYYKELEQKLLNYDYFTKN